MNSTETASSSATPPEKKRSLFRDRRSSQQTQPWEYVCLCGQKLSGIREVKAQVARCEHCDRPHFVLPASRYPEKSSRKKRKRKKRDQSLWKTGWQIARGNVTGAASALIKLVEIFFEKLVAFLRKRIRELINWFTPLRSALVVLVLVIFSGAGLAVRQSRLDQALQTLRVSSEAGEQAVAEQNWDLAAEEYLKAVRACEILGRDDEFAWELRQKSQELQAIIQLCQIPLPEVMEKATGKGKFPGTWPDFFQGSVQNRWVVVECWVVPAPDYSMRKWLQIQHPLPLAGEWVTVFWPADLLPASVGPLTDPVHLLCAGKIESLEHSETTAEWELRMQPESCFLWCFPETAQAIGYDGEAPWLPENSLEPLLLQQQQWTLSGH